MASLGRDTAKGTSTGDQLGSSPMTGILATLAPHMYAAVHCDREGKLTAVRSDLGTGLLFRPPGVRFSSVRKMMCSGDQIDRNRIKIQSRTAAYNYFDTDSFPARLKMRKGD